MQHAILTTRLFSGLLALAVVLLLPAAAVRAESLAGVPFTKIITLSDGTMVGLPSYFKAKASVVIGFSDVSALAALQRGNSAFKPVSILNKGITFIWTIEYVPGTYLGSYREIIFSHLAKRQAQSLNATIDFSTTSKFIKQISAAAAGIVVFYDAMWLESDLGIEAGTQIWGLPKLKGLFTAGEVKGLGRQALAVQDSLSGDNFFYAHLPLPAWHLIPSLPVSTITGVTPGDWSGANSPQEYATKCSTGPFALRLWDPLTDRLSIGGGTSQTDMLKEMNFSPLLIMDFSDVELLSDGPAEN